VHTLRATLGLVDPKPFTLNPTPYTYTLNPEPSLRRWVGVGAHALRTYAARSAPTLAYISACLAPCPRVVARRTGVHIHSRSRGSPKRREGTARNGTAKTKRRAGARQQIPSRRLGVWLLSNFWQQPGLKAIIEEGWASQKPPERCFSKK